MMLTFTGEQTLEEAEWVCFTTSPVWQHMIHIYGWQTKMCENFPLTFFNLKLMEQLK